MIRRMFPPDPESPERVCLKHRSELCSNVDIRVHNRRIADHWFHDDVGILDGVEQAFLIGFE